MLFKTVHGSKLYGLSHAGSDDDFYVVVNTRRTAKARYAKQSIVNGIDTTTVDVGTWVNMCQSGVPQALEAMFSTRPVFEAEGMSEFRAAFRMGSSARGKYYRTMDNFLADVDFKRNRHALRLALNLREGLRFERFNPTLSHEEVAWVNWTVTHLSLDNLRRLCLDSIPGEW